MRTNKKRLLYQGFITYTQDPVHDGYTRPILILSPKSYPCHEEGWGDSIVPISEDKENWIRLIDVLGEEIKGQTVTLRFWISDEVSTLEEAKTNFIEQILGFVEAKFLHHYSEITGYLYTDEELNVGGHDIPAIFRNYIGKYLILEIFIH